MKQHQGIWLPDHERHMIEWMDKSGQIVNGRGTYQYKKLVGSLEHVKNWRTVVDVGAHVGFWSMHLAPKFQNLEAFEPVAEHRECWVENMKDQMRDYGRDSGCELRLHECALGASDGTVSMVIPPGSSGGTHIGGAGWIPMKTLDSFNLQDVDFLKIDCEGAESAVLEGGVETLKRCRPCVIVEQKGHIMAANFGTKGRPAVDFLIGLGAIFRREMGGDFILSWD